jgi:RimJ/RimL family protein N-acetyltransferase
MNDLTFRPAALNDAALLFEWRNDPETRRNSHDTQPIAFDQHCAWLRKILAQNDHIILIAEEAGIPVGTVRYRRDESHAATLSWTVAPNARGRGVATRMVRGVAEGPLRHLELNAEIKLFNTASIHVAHAAGLMLESTINDILHFRRPPLD